MLRHLFASLLLLHGFIHVFGFINQWVSSLGTQLSGKSLITLSSGTSKLLGGLWLLVGLCFLMATVAFWLESNWWTTLALFSVVLSQILIIIYWPDAKAGTVLNVLIALGIGIAMTHHRFEQYTNLEARQIMTKDWEDRSVITTSMLTGLPMPVQKWLTASGVVGKERVHTVRLRQHGLMRTSPDGAWMPTEAEQYIDVDKPGFVWKADVKLLSFLPLSGVDKFVNGKGNMLIKALSFVPIVNESNPKIDQGELLRYLSEMCWYPSAALSPYVSWKPVDATHALAIITYEGLTASAIFAFDNQHKLISVAAKRYKGSDAQSKLENWFIPARVWKSMNGILIPVKGDVMWQLASGDFTYYQWEITDIAYNKQMLY
ncbi:DUF6544 family protein [Spirosoma litoris]